MLIKQRGNFMRILEAMTDAAKQENNAVVLNVCVIIFSLHPLKVESLSCNMVKKNLTMILYEKRYPYKKLGNTTL